MQKQYRMMASWQNLGERSCIYMCVCVWLCLYLVFKGHMTVTVGFTLHLMPSALSVEIDGTVSCRPKACTHAPFYGEVLLSWRDFMVKWYIKTNCVFHIMYHYSLPTYHQGISWDILYFFRALHNSSLTIAVHSLVSLLSVENIFIIPHRAKEKAEEKKRIFLSSDGDHATLLRVYRACKVGRVSCKVYISNLIEIKCNMLIYCIWRHWL